VSAVWWMTDTGWSLAPLWGFHS